MHGIGNDFVVVDAVSAPLQFTNIEQLAKDMNDRKFGIGGDGLIIVTKGEKAPFKMQMLNPDGSEAEMCGNGIRCVAKLVREKGLTNSDLIPIETGAGLLELGVEEVAGLVNRVRVNMGVARLKRAEIPMAGPADSAAAEFSFEAAGAHLTGTAVNMGNPHVVVFVDDAAAVSLETLGPAIENHPQFPNRINVHFAQVISRSEIRMRTWERGAGVTLACGTGACAVLVAANTTGRTGRSALLHLPGGDLNIEYAEDGTVYMTGPAETVFEGIWDPS
jgi:diaminopimelate epimerase